MTILGGGFPTFHTWAPIETAPKDRRVLLFRPVNEQYRENQIAAGKYNHDGSYWEIDTIRIHGVRDAKKHPPTHWMELPAEPVKKNLGEE